MSETVKVKALVGFQTTMLGSIAPGQVFECKPARAAQFVAEGRAVPYSTKVVKSPLESSLPASPVAQALPEQTAKESKRGGKKKQTEE